MPKYKDFLKKVISEQKNLVSEYKDIEEKYTKDPSKFKEKFNEIGSNLHLQLKKMEEKLCLQSEKGSYSKYSNNLSQKYWESAYAVFPKLKEVQVKYEVKGVNVDDLF